MYTDSPAPLKYSDIKPSITTKCLWYVITVQMFITCTYTTTSHTSTKLCKPIIKESIYLTFLSSPQNNNQPCGRSSCRNTSFELAYKGM